MQPVAGRGVAWITLVTACLVLASAQAFGAEDIATVVGKVNQAQYTTYQVKVQNMGLDLPDQGYRSRDELGGGDPLDGDQGNPGNRETQVYLANQFTGMGLNVSVQGTFRNVVAELPGAKTPDTIYIVCAHYDTYDNTFNHGVRPGGDDNASGTAGVLEAARVLSQYQFNSTIRFIAFNGEEGWMWGSHDYVDNVVWPNHQNIAGVINLDMILRPGWDSQPSHVKDLNIETQNTPSCTALAGKFVAAAAAYAPALPIDPVVSHANSNAGDQGPFLAKGFTAIDLLENTVDDIWNQGSNAYYHTSDDASDGMANNPNNGTGITYDYAFATDVVRATVGTLAGEAVLTTPEPATMALLAAGGVGMLLRRRRK